MRWDQLAVVVGSVVWLAVCEGGESGGAEREREINRSDISIFIEQVKENLIFIKGGEFLMGDFGTEYGAEKLPYDSGTNSTPLHQVALSDFWIFRYKVTNREYQFYVAANDVSVEAKKYDRKYKILSEPSNHPAHVDWNQAEKFCNWLARESGLPFTLPTEAQWEYAARGGGKFQIVSTDDGTYHVINHPYTSGEEGRPRGINISTSRDRSEYAKKMGWDTDGYMSFPVDHYPPNALGIYSMTDNGYEWVSDWYDPHYYKYSPVENPQGPTGPAFKGDESNGIFAKVLRGNDVADHRWPSGPTVQRRPASPDASYNFGGDYYVLSNKTMRCVLNAEVGAD